MKYQLHSFLHLFVPIFSILNLFFVGCKGSDSLQPLTPATLPPVPQTISLSISKYFPAQGNMFKNIFVSNFSEITSRGQAYLSTAKDGLSDDFKTNAGSSFGFSLTGPYTGTAGYSNLVLYLTGISAIQQNDLYCNSTGLVSSQCMTLNPTVNNCASDAFSYTPQGASSPLFLGLSDCEKTFLNLNINLFDSNGNGVPDYLKFRCGLNPYNKSDANVSIANDSLNNVEKCRKHLPIDENANSQLNSIFSYQYATTQNTDGSKNFLISNITVLNGGQENFIAIYIVEAGISTQKEFLSSSYLITNSSIVGTAPVSIPYWGLKTNVNIPIGTTR